MGSAVSSIGKMPQKEDKNATPAKGQPIGTTHKARRMMG